MLFPRNGILLNQDDLPKVIQVIFPMYKKIMLVFLFPTSIFGMAAMPFLCNGTLLFQGNIPRVLLVTINKSARCLIPYIVSFLILCGEWPSLVFKDFKKYFSFKPNVYIFFKQK